MCVHTCVHMLAGAHVGAGQCVCESICIWRGPRGRPQVLTSRIKFPPLRHCSDIILYKCINVNREFCSWGGGMGKHSYFLKEEPGCLQERLG